MAVEQSVHGLRPAPPAAPLSAAGYGAAAAAGASSPGSAVVAPGGGTLVLPCEHALLQFWDVRSDRHLARLQVAPRNPVSRTEAATNAVLAAAGGRGEASAAGPLLPAVVLLAFTGDGACLITVDVRPSTGAVEHGASARTHMHTHTCKCRHTHMCM